MINQAIILAGGLGTRLRGAVPDLPKCMAPVAGRPFITYVIDYYLQQGIDNFIFSLGYKHEVIGAFLKQRYPSLPYQCSIEEEPLGTGGAILKACKMTGADVTLVLNGDTFFKIALKALSDLHENSQSDCTLSLKPMIDSDRYGVVQLNDDGAIHSFMEKKWYAKSLINGGAYALNPAGFLAEGLPEKFSFEKDYLQGYSGRRKMYGSVQNAYFIDIGIPEDYRKAQTELPANIY